MLKEITLIVGVKSNGKESKDELLKMVEKDMNIRLNLPIANIKLMTLAEISKILKTLVGELGDVKAQMTSEIIGSFSSFVKVIVNVDEREYNFIQQILENADIDTDIAILLAFVSGEKKKPKKKKANRFVFVPFPILIPTYRLDSNKNLYKSIQSEIVYDLDYLKSLKGGIFNVVKFTGLDRANSFALLRTALEIKVLSTKTFDYHSENFVKVGTYKIKNIELSGGRIVITGTLKKPRYLNKELNIDSCCDIKPISLTMLKEGRKMVKEIIGFVLINMCEDVSKQREVLKDIYGS